MIICECPFGMWVTDHEEACDVRCWVPVTSRVFGGRGPGRQLGPWRPVCSPQVPQDEWGGRPLGGRDDEIPCRRMRSGSYIKAMGDEDSGDSDSSPKTSPKLAIHRTEAAGRPPNVSPPHFPHPSPGLSSHEPAVNPEKAQDWKY